MESDTRVKWERIVSKLNTVLVWHFIPKGGVNDDEALEALAHLIDWLTELEADALSTVDGSDTQ